MDWLTQNWIYLLLLAGVIVFMRFGGMGCGMAGRRAHPEHKPGAQPGPGHRVESAPATDPISRRPVDPKSAVATMHQGRAYYFESRENRDRFEASPEKYAEPASGRQAEQGHQGHGGGCC